MKLVRYNPLNAYAPGTIGDVLENALRNDADSKRNLFPAVDIIKNDDEFELQLIAPGMQKSDFIIDIEENELTISWERRVNDKLNYAKTESRFGNFSRSFSLSDNILKDGIKATYKNGILHVVLPIDKKKLEKKTIEVK